jgi:hypothetical protein
MSGMLLMCMRERVVGGFRVKKKRYQTGGEVGR